MNNPARATILVVDNYDSFVYNLVQYLEQLGATCVVRRNDEVTPQEVLTLGAGGGSVDGVLLSPGPGVPAEAGVTEDMITFCAGKVPVLGVCLGHQAIAEVFGGVVDRAPELLHGRTSLVHHNSAGVFEDLPDPFTATRYHSLAVVDSTVPEVLEVTARTEGGVIMGLRHRVYAIEGVQFHPESVLTQGGHRMLASWLAECGFPQARDAVAALEQDVEALRVSAL
ncbi:aminodeoxychorismate/anthranilate synthase component II [Nakamurella antarctica]|uniref:aminodeoxychorismate/anthranilate synthase component II n=1 Tax=Nakamurella antarctica TaxID=1902245 RepID=UPI001EEFFA6B|nr:aminodeoxychorismate/anthranilate synthase component II [Nakamurella antarctica]